MKKKLVQINTVPNGSVGRIMKEIQSQAEKDGFDTISFVGRRRIYDDIKCERFGNLFSFWSHVIITTVFDKQGHGSYFATRKLIKRIREEKPDIIHLHNLHGYYLHIPTLMKYLKEEFTGQLFWTFHDCWPFTGHCPYFTMAQCDKWKTGCFRCPNKRQYPVSLFLDSSRSNYNEKKEWFTDIHKLSIIVPSQWLAGLVQQSFMSEYKIYVIPNGINSKVFHPSIDAALTIKKYKIPKDRKIILGVADIWSKRKGIDDFIKLSEVLPVQYIIVLVGIKKREIKKLPLNIIGIPHTENMEDLAALYAAAHIFMNPSLEETFSLVTAEALACGTPVIALDTSAVKELVPEKCGIILHEHSAGDYIEAIKKLTSEYLNRSQVANQGSLYSASIMAEKIVKLYSM